MSEHFPGDTFSPDMDILSERSKLVMAEMRRVASRKRNPSIGVTHLMYGVMQEGGDAGQVLFESGIKLQEVEDYIDLVDVSLRREKKRPPMTPRLREIGRRALGEAFMLGDRKIEPEHFVLAALSEHRTAKHLPLNTLAELVVAHQVSLDTLTGELTGRVHASFAEDVIARKAMEDEIATLEEWLRQPSHDSDS